MYYALHPPEKKLKWTGSVISLDKDGNA